MTVNNRVEKVRKSQTLTMEKFGERLGVGKTAISKIANGYSNPSDQLLRSICREFRVDETWLRTGEGEMYAPVSDGVYLDELAERHALSEQERLALGVFIRLDAADRAAIMRYVDQLVEEFAPERTADRTTLEELEARVDALEKGDASGESGSA